MSHWVARILKLEYVISYHKVTATWAPCRVQMSKNSVRFEPKKCSPKVHCVLGIIENLEGERQVVMSDLFATCLVDGTKEGPFFIFNV